MPMPNQPALLAPFWDDLVLQPQSRVCTKVQGKAGLRTFTVTWRQVSRYAQSNTSLTFSMVLHEDNGAIDFVYDDLFALAGAEAFVSGVRAAVGVQAAGGFAHAVHRGVVSVSRKLRFTPRR